MLVNLSATLQSAFDGFEQTSVRAPEVSRGIHRSIGIDNQQQGEYDLTLLRNVVSTSTTTRTPMVQIVGDSGTPFDQARIPAAQTILSSYLAGCMVEYGFTASTNDTNWLVNGYLASHPDTVSIANVVRQSIGALESGWEGFEDASHSLLLYDRSSPTKFGDDVWLSDGLMSKECGDKILCFEGGPQALEQCSNVLLKGIEVVAVTNLRSARFSAARLLIAVKEGIEHAEQYLVDQDSNLKRPDMVRQILSTLKKSEVDIASLILPVEIK